MSEFTEDDVASDFVDAIDDVVVGQIGWSTPPTLTIYEWPGDEDKNDGTWPFTVVRDGREFEVDIDVCVTELTPEREAKRAAEHERLKELIRAATERTKS